MGRGPGPRQHEMRIGRRLPIAHRVSRTGHRDGDCCTLHVEAKRIADHGSSESTAGPEIPQAYNKKAPGRSQRPLFVRRRFQKLLDFALRVPLSLTRDLLANEGKGQRWVASPELKNPIELARPASLTLKRREGSVRVLAQSLARSEKMVRPARLERATARFEVWCSIR